MATTLLGELLSSLGYIYYLCQVCLLLMPCTYVASILYRTYVAIGCMFCVAISSKYVYCQSATNDWGYMVEVL